MHPYPYPHYGRSAPSTQVGGLVPSHSDPSQWNGASSFQRGNAFNQSIAASRDLTQSSYPPLYNASMPTSGYEDRQLDGRRPLPEPGHQNASQALPPRSNSMMEFTSQANNNMYHGVQRQQTYGGSGLPILPPTCAQGPSKRPLPTRPPEVATTPLSVQSNSAPIRLKDTLPSNGWTRSMHPSTGVSGAPSKRALPPSPSAPPDLSRAALQSVPPSTALQQTNNPRDLETGGPPTFPVSGILPPRRFHSPQQDVSRSSLPQAPRDSSGPPYVNAEHRSSVSVEAPAWQALESSLVGSRELDKFTTVAFGADGPSKSPDKELEDSAHVKSDRASNFRYSKERDPSIGKDMPSSATSNHVSWTTKAVGANRPVPVQEHLSDPPSSVSLTLRLAAMSLEEDKVNGMQGAGGKFPSSKAGPLPSKTSAIPVRMWQTETLEDSPPQSFRELSTSASLIQSQDGTDDRTQIPKLSFAGVEQVAEDASPAISTRPSIPKIVFGEDSDESPDDAVGPSITISPAVPTIAVLSSDSDDFSGPELHPNRVGAKPGTDKQREVVRKGGLICGGCGKGIVGRIVSAIGVRWHPSCFQCSVCDELLEHVSAYEHDGKPYCHLDYYEHFGHKCYHCKTPIIDEQFITLDDPQLGKRIYHEQHFFCAECGDPFLSPSGVDEDDVGFTVYRGHAYCEACHVRLRMPRCSKCKKSIREGMPAVEALGGKWCQGCFVCAGCDKPFETPSFFQRGNLPFCESCFSIIIKGEMD